MPLSTMRGLAEVLSRMGRSEKALQAAEQALRLQPAIVEAHLASVGTAYAVAGRPEQALAPLQRFLSRYPNMLQARLTLAAVYSELGRRAKARAKAAEVLLLSPALFAGGAPAAQPLKDPAQLSANWPPCAGQGCGERQRTRIMLSNDRRCPASSPEQPAASRARHGCGGCWTSAADPLIDSDAGVVTQHGGRLCIGGCRYRTYPH